MGDIVMGRRAQVSIYRLFTLGGKASIRSNREEGTERVLSQEEKSRLIHQYRTTLLNRMFEELGSKSPNSTTQQISEDIVATAERIQSALSEAAHIDGVRRGVFVLALQQVVDSLIAGLLSDEAFEWLAEEQTRVDRESV
jgi:hypothetical protein